MIDQPPMTTTVASPPNWPMLPGRPATLARSRQTIYRIALQFAYEIARATDSYEHCCHVHSH